MHKILFHFLLFLQVCSGRNLPIHDDARAGDERTITDEGTSLKARTIETKEPGRGISVFASPGLDGYMTQGNVVYGNNDPSVQNWIGDKRTWYGLKNRNYYNSDNNNNQQLQSGFAGSTGYNQGYGQGFMGPQQAGGPFPFGRPPSGFLEMLFLPFFAILNVSGTTAPPAFYNQGGARM